jgi:hypothetical protein
VATKSRTRVLNAVTYAGLSANAIGAAYYARTGSGIAASAMAVGMLTSSTVKLFEYGRQIEADFDRVAAEREMSYKSQYLVKRYRKILVAASTLGAVLMFTGVVAGADALGVYLGHGDSTFGQALDYLLRR